MAARGRLLVMSEVGSENKISHAPGRVAAPASPKLLLHTLPAALLLALKQPPCNPSHSRVRKARGPRRDKPILLLAAIRRENADVVNASQKPSLSLCHLLPSATSTEVVKHGR